MSLQARGQVAWRLLRDARLAAGLTQAEVARRAGTSQSAVARYESAQTLPDIPTLSRLLHACGHRLELRAVPVDWVDQSQLRESVALPSERRVDRNRAMTALAARAGAARRAGRVKPLRERR
jgi:transcriptional regulator with XRE-family HTH domain